MTVRSIGRRVVQGQKIVVLYQQQYFYKPQNHYKPRRKGKQQTEEQKSTTLSRRQKHSCVDIVDVQHISPSSIRVELLLLYVV